VALWLNGVGATVHELLTRFPTGLVVEEPELATLTAFDELLHGSLEQAERQLALATRLAESVAEERRMRVETLLASVRVRLARQRSDLAVVVQEAERLLGPGDSSDAAARDRH
jgi:ATP/maltotriose-dependent transcriptional regulator MalT